jgi:hypothetical protein
MPNLSPVMIDIPAAVSSGNACSGSQAGSCLSEESNSWIASARFLLAWLSPALSALYLKWYAMKDLGGFEKVARSMGFQSLTTAERLSIFRSDVVIGFLCIPLILLIMNRYVAPRWAAIITGVCSIFFFLLFAIQLRALEEVGRYISMSMILIALRWGLHPPREL